MKLIKIIISLSLIILLIISTTKRVNNEYTIPVKWYDIMPKNVEDLKKKSKKRR